MKQQEYIRGVRESILLPIAVCKHPLPSTEVKLHHLTQKFTTNIWHITRACTCTHDSGIVSNDKHQNTMGGHAPVLVCGDLYVVLITLTSVLNWQRVFAHSNRK